MVSGPGNPGRMCMYFWLLIGICILAIVAAEALEDGA